MPITNEKEEKLQIKADFFKSLAISIFLPESPLSRGLQGDVVYLG
jgi:hypothetical protein